MASISLPRHTASHAGGEDTAELTAQSRQDALRKLLGDDRPAVGTYCGYVGELWERFGVAYIYADRNGPRFGVKVADVPFRLELGARVEVSVNGIGEVSAVKALS